MLIGGASGDHGCLLPAGVVDLHAWPLRQCCDIRAKIMIRKRMMYHELEDRRQECQRDRERRYWWLRWGLGRYAELLCCRVVKWQTQ